MQNRRLQKELRQLQKNSIDNISASPVSDDIFTWNAVIIGPTDTPYFGGIFRLSIKIGKDYPARPPKVRFLNKIFHPNISVSGSICLDILKDNWSPLQSIRTILLSVSSLLASPNPEDPLEDEHATLYKSDREEFNRVAQLWTQLYAS